MAFTTLAQPTPVAAALPTARFIASVAVQGPMPMLASRCTVETVSPRTASGAPGIMLPARIPSVYMVIRMTPWEW